MAVTYAADSPRAPPQSTPRYSEVSARRRTPRSRIRRHVGPWTPEAKSGGRSLPVLARETFLVRGGEDAARQVVVRHMFP